MATAEDFMLIHWVNGQHYLCSAVCMCGNDETTLDLAHSHHLWAKGDFVRAEIARTFKFWLQNGHLSQQNVNVTSFDDFPWWIHIWHMNLPYVQLPFPFVGKMPRFLHNSRVVTWQHSVSTHLLRCVITWLSKSTQQYAVYMFTSTKNV